MANHQWQIQCHCRLIRITHDQNRYLIEICFFFFKEFFVLSLVLFQILKSTKKERERERSCARTRDPILSLFRFYTHFFSCAKSCACVCVCFLLSSMRISFRFVLFCSCALILMEAFFKKEQVFSLSLVCMHFFLLSLLTDAPAAFLFYYYIYI